jgi:hypothetical protein
LVTKCIEINLHFAFMPLFKLVKAARPRTRPSKRRVEFAAQPHPRPIRLHQVERHMAQDGEVVRAVIVAISRLVLVHDGVENSVKPVFDTAMQTCDLAKAFGRQRGAEQV